MSDIDIRLQRMPLERKSRERLKYIIVHLGELFELKMNVHVRKYGRQDIHFLNLCISPLKHNISEEKIYELPS